MSPLISIIIATYNAEKTLHDALESVLNQSFQDWECLVVDGASKDNTVKIIEEFCKQDKRFRYISEPDKGIYDAFNKGWKMAKGEWIYYLGADDLLIENAIESIFNNNDFSNVGIIYGNVVFKTNRNELHKKSNENVSYLKKHMICSHQAMIMRKSVIQEMNGFDLRYKVSSDFDLTLRCYLSAKTFKYIDVNIAIFDCSGVSNGINATKEAFMLRKNNHSINFIENSFIYITALTKHYLKRIIHSFL